MNIEISDASCFGLEIQFNSDNIREYKNNKLFAKLVNLFKDDHAFLSVSLIIDKLDCLPYIRVSVNYEDSSISVKYDLENKETEVNIELYEGSSEHASEIWPGITDYVVWLAKRINDKDQSHKKRDEEEESPLN